MAIGARSMIEVLAGFTVVTSELRSEIGAGFYVSVIIVFSSHRTAVDIDGGVT